MNVVGLDLSLTATGYADGTGAVVLVPARGLVGIPRLEHILEKIRQRADEWPSTTVVVVEGYGFHSQKAVALGELGGVVRLFLHTEGHAWVDVAPAMLKKFATGKGNARKPEMLDAAIRRWAYEGPADDNAVDAYLLRCMGLVQYTRQHAPGYAYEAIEKIAWPEPVSA